MQLICGLIRLDGAPVDPATLPAMEQAMTGPALRPHIRRHAAAHSAFACLTFGGEPPVALPATPASVLVGDIRLDQPDAVCRTLHLPCDSSDERIALQAAEHWGATAAERLDGDFAFALWQQAADRLLLCRDIMGVRPLCWAYEPGRWFAFASVPQALHAPGLRLPCLDQLGQGRLLLESFHRDERTSWQGIRWLLPGHALTLERGTLDIRRMWQPQAGAVGSWRGTPAEAATTLRTLLQQAVAARLPRQGPLCSHLSGGLDSSGVVALAATLAPKRAFHVFAQLADPRHGLAFTDETPFVQAVLDQYPHLELHRDHLCALPPSEGLQPEWGLGLTATASHQRIAAMVARQGGHRLLCGVGGDEAATYNGAYLSLSVALDGHVLHGWRQLQQRARRQHQSLARHLLWQWLYPLFPSWMRGGRRRANVAADLSFGILRSTLAQTLAAGCDQSALHWRNRPEDRINMIVHSYVSGRATLWALLTARYGVACTFPLLDRRVIEFCWSLPVHLLMDQGFARQPYRNAMHGLLPDRVRLRENKYVPFPDLPHFLVEQVPASLNRLEQLRHHEALHTWFDLAALEHGLRTPPLAAPGSVDVGAGFPRRLFAERALVLAEQVAHWGWSS